MAHPGHEYWPLFDLRVRTPRVELRYPDDELVVELARLAAKGIHDPDFMPFGVEWTDTPSPQLERKSLQHYWLARGQWTPEKWEIGFATICDGVVVGSQAMHGDDFAVLGTIETGSWLGRAHQGHGIGKEMRAAILHLIFAGLGARRAISGAWHDNKPSLGVSRALGYVENGDDTRMRRGQPDRHINLKLDREDWEPCRRDDVVIENLEPCLPMFGAASSE